MRRKTSAYTTSALRMQRKHHISADHYLQRNTIHKTTVRWYCIPWKV